MIPQKTMKNQENQRNCVSVGAGASQTAHHFQYGNHLKDSYNVNIISCVAISFKGCTNFLKGNYFMRNYEELNGVMAGQKSEVTYQQGLKGCDCLLKNLGMIYKNKTGNSNKIQEINKALGKEELA